MSESNLPTSGDPGPYSLPINTLIVKLSNFVEPYAIRQRAKAEADALTIKTEAEIAAADLLARAARDREMESVRFYVNKCAILAAAAEEVPNDVGANVDNEWASNFFDKAKHISRPEAQKFWAQLLAGEARKPGSYSKRTVNLLAELESHDATLFQALCNHVWIFGGPVPVVIDHTADIYARSQINFSTLSRLDEVGLIRFSAIGALKKVTRAPFLTAAYGPMNFHVRSSSGKPLEIPFGQVDFTQAGLELFNLCDRTVIPGFVDYVRAGWASSGVLMD
jgi:hypothetical protein